MPVQKRPQTRQGGALMQLVNKIPIWRHWFLAGVVLVSASCATTQSNPWETVEVDQAPAERPLPLPVFPVPVSFTAESVTFDLAGAQELEAFRVAALANTEVANEHASQVDSYREAVGHLVDAGKAQRRIADMRQEMLEDERRHHVWTSIGYWVAIIGLAAAL